MESNTFQFVETLVFGSLAIQIYHSSHAIASTAQRTDQLPTRRRQYLSGYSFTNNKFKSNIQNQKCMADNVEDAAAVFAYVDKVLFIYF